MATKEKLLELLQKQPGVYLSGQELGQLLGVSRASVWKAVKALEGQGYAIDAVTNKGYCLRKNADLLSEDRISRLLTGDFWKIQVTDSLPSTNSALRVLAGQGAPQGTVLLAESQSAGRGRMGRTFFSPEGTGLYLSLLLRPQDLPPEKSLQITTMAAAALCLAIEETTGQKPGIKWVNDLYLNGRKICGILTEGSVNLETGLLQDAVLGLGLNLYPPREGFPEALQNIAGSLCTQTEPGLKNRLAAAFLNRFSYFYLEKRYKEAARIYRSRSILPGKQVLAGGKPVTVLDVNDRCQLVVRDAEGNTRSLSYGEVTIVNCL